MVQYLKYRNIFSHILGTFWHALIITLIVLSLILLLYLIIMFIYWRCIEKSKSDEQQRRLREENEPYSDHYRRYGDTPKIKNVSDSPVRTLEEGISEKRLNDQQHEKMSEIEL